MPVPESHSPSSDRPASMITRLDFPGALWPPARGNVAPCRAAPKPPWCAGFARGFQDRTAPTFWSPSQVPFLKTPPAFLGRPALALILACLIASPSVAARSPATPPSPARAFDPAETLEGNYLAAYIAGASRDTAAAAAFYREALKDDPKNAELLERAFVSLPGRRGHAGSLPRGRASRRAGTVERPRPARPRRARDLKAASTASRARTTQPGRQGPRGGPHGDASDRLGLAGAGDGKRALETVDRLKGERAYSRVPRLPCRADRRSRRQRRRGRAPPQGGLRGRQATRCASSTPTAASRPGAGAPRQRSQAYNDFETLAAPPSDRARRAREAARPASRSARSRLARRTAPPRCSTGSASAGGTQGDELPAIVYLRLALYLNPDHALALVTLADVLSA